MKKVIFIIFLALFSNISITYSYTHFGWGSNNIGQIGDGSTTDRLTPTEVSTSDWKFITSGLQHTLAIKPDGTLWAWGSNGDSQLGDSTTNEKLSPVKIGKDKTWSCISAGDGFSIGLKSDGTIWSWGYWGWGSLGTGATSDQLVPTRIGTGTNWKAIACGGCHTLAIKTDGTLWAWGYNSRGQIGDGTTEAKTTPVKIGTETNWKSVFSSSSSQSSYAIKSDGTLWAWGYNYYGQLGDNSTTNRLSPKKIGTSTDWKKIACGVDYTLGLKTNNTLWAWGNNLYGTFGDGTEEGRIIPGQVGNLTTWMDIACGERHSSAVKTDSTLWGTGYNYYGQVGDGTTTQRYAFKSIASGSKFGSVSSGTSNSVALSSTSNPTKSIDCNITKNSFIKGEYVEVEYVVTNGPLNNGNHFYIQMSNSQGDFANSLQLADITGTTSGKKLVKLPDSLSNGTKYRIRIISTSPELIGSDNGSDITINTPPVILITPNALTQHTTMPIFKWQAVSGATKYNIQVFKDKFMATKFFGDEITGKTESSTNEGWLKNWNDISYNDTVYWSVSYYKNSDWSNYSPPRGLIKIEGNPPKVTISSDTIIVSNTGTSVLSLTNSGGGYLSWSVPDMWKTPWVNMSVQSGELQSNQTVNIQISGTAPQGNRLGLINILNNAGNNVVVTVIYTPVVYDFAYVNWLDSQPEVGVGINPINETFSHYDKTSFSIPGASFDLVFEHMYSTPNTNTYRPVPASVGVAWLHNYSFIIEKLVDKVIAHHPDGNIGYYKYDNNKYKPLNPGNYDSLYTASGFYYLITKSQTVYKFQELVSNSYIWYLKSIKDRNNNELVLTYDANQRLTKVTNPENRSLTFEYYPANSNWPSFIKNVLDYTGRKVEFIYNYPDNNLVTYINLAGDTTHYTYVTDTNRIHLLKKIKLPKGNWIENSYNDLKIASQSVSGLPGSLVITKQSATTSQITDQLGNITKIEYDKANFGNIKKTTSPNKEITLYEYSDTTNKTLPTKVTDACGYWSKYQYDYKGNVKKITQPYNIIHQYQYNKTNDVTQYIDPRNKTYTNNYDANGNLTSMQTPRATVSFTYNTNGTVKTIKDPLNRTTTYAYNSYGDVNKITDNLNYSSTFDYDNISRLASSSNPKSQKTQYEYLNNDLVSKVIDPMSNQTKYTYDKNDNLISLTDPKNNSTQFNYDSTDLFRSIKNPLNNQTSYDYNKDGLISSRTTPKGDVFNFAYDSTSRLNSITGAKSCGFTYFKNGTLNQAKYTSGPNVQYKYDSLNRVIKYYNSMSGDTITFKYDLGSNISSIVYPGNKTVTYQYWDDNLLKSVTDWNNRATNYYYLADGTLDSVVNGNSTVTKYRYDSGGRLTELINKKSNGEIIASYKFTLDEIGNHVAVEYKEPLSIAGLSSDKVDYNYNQANRLTSSTDYSYTYDNNGNQLTETGTPSTSFTFDVDSKLKSIKSGTNTSSFDYDVFLNRTIARRNGTVTKYTLNGDNQMSQILMEKDSATGTKTYYIYGMGLISRIKNDGTTTNWYHSDIRGSVIAMTDANQSITHKYNYDVYGKCLNSTEPTNDNNKFRFLGNHGIIDEGNGLYYIRARYYDSELGRFISEDQNWDANLYVYGGDNPVGLVDVDGNVFQKANELKGAVGDAEILIHIIRIKNWNPTRALNIVKDYAKFDASWLAVAAATENTDLGREVFNKNKFDEFTTALSVVAKGSTKDWIGVAKAIPNNLLQKSSYINSAKQTGNFGVKIIKSIGQGSWNLVKDNSKKFTQPFNRTNYLFKK
ncbi:MAG: RHS repeat-associated core domain-containing protein [bacterium]